MMDGSPMNFSSSFCELGDGIVMRVVVSFKQSSSQFVQVFHVTCERHLVL